MFGSHLSSASTRKQQSSTPSKKNENSGMKQDSSADNVFSFLEVSESLQEMEGDGHKATLGGRLKFEDFFNGKITHPYKECLAPGQVQLQYTKASGIEKLDRDVMMQFWYACGAMLLSDSGITRIITDSQNHDRALHLQAIEFQKDVLEYNFGVEKSWGCQQLGMITKHYPDDKELHQGAGAFMKVAMYSYIEQLKYRAKMRGKTLRSTGELTRNQILEFFEGCNAAMSLETTKAALRKTWDKFQDVKLVGKATIEVQHRILELLGVKHTHGVEQLNAFMQAHLQDTEIADRFEAFRMCAEMGTKMATMTPSELKEVLAEVPPYMRDVPHIYFVQSHKMAMEQQRRVTHANPNTPQGRSMLAEQYRVLEFMGSEAGQEKVGAISKRIKTAQTTFADIAQNWDETQRAEYLEKFSKFPFVLALTECGGDMLKRISVFDSIDEKGLQEIVTMQQVLVKDARSGGSLLTKLRDDPAAIGVAVSMQSLNAMQKLASIEKGTNLQMPDMGHGHDHGHGHGHEHVHGPDCNHGPNKAKAPDVTTGKADRIER